MRVIIIEDERPSAEKLLQAITTFNSDARILAVFASVQASVEWLQQHPPTRPHFYGYPAYRWPLV
ncbi:MAG: hypothetical protein IPP72_06775 [Chitinophagaceae bacterium]|nr:hypothetical protein [Chitinophagaceae bacterium]